MIGIAFLMLNPRSKTLFNFYLVLLLLLAFFRYGVGPDYFAYNDLYSLVNTPLLDQIGESVGQELLFRLLGSTFNYLNFSYQAYLAIVAIITLWYIRGICLEYSKYPVFSLYLFYCMFYFVWVFSGIRQGLTLAIGVYYLLHCIDKKNPIKFIIIVGILSLIHQSALILLPFYFLVNLKLKKKTILIGIFICFCISLIPHSYIMTVISYFPNSHRVEFYYRPENGELAVSFFDFKSISRLILLISFGVLLTIKSKGEECIQDKIINLYLISFGIYYAFKFIEIVASNLSMYGFILIMIIIPNIYYRFRNSAKSKIFIFAIIIFSILYYFKTLLSMEEYSDLNNNSLLTPYTHIFDKHPKYFK